MSQWWTYQPADVLMFSPDTYYRLFELYNAEVWPTQIVALGAGVCIAVLMFRGPRWRGRAVATLLAAIWLAVAWAYFLERYATINLAAPFFAWGFVAQAILTAVSGILLGRLTFEDAKGLTGNSGIALFIFALLLQSLIGPFIGREWSGAELFGLAPDPTVLGTLGVLLASDRVRWELFIIPILWCAITGAILWTMRSPEALLMPLAALSVLILAAHRSFRLRRGLAGI